MSLLGLKDAAIKMVFGLLSIGIVGGWVWLANLAASQDELRSDHRVWAEKLSTIAEDVKEIKADVKELSSPVVPTIAQERLDAIENAIKRQNCLLSGGPNKIPKPPTCAGIY